MQPTDAGEQARHGGVTAGASSAPRVIVMENHDAAFTAWSEAGVRDRVLVHIDAHHDLFCVDDRAQITIANFLSPTLRDGLVRELYWIVPDPSWASPADRAEYLAQLDDVLRGYGDRRARVLVTPQRMTTTILGHPVIVGPLAALAGVQAEVLLDIDTDYLVVDRIYSESDAHRRLPWCWPADLLTRLADIGLRADVVTIPYSVEGGYTPLRWKYLGDELAARIRNDDPVRLEGFDLLRRGMEAAQEQRMDDAERCLADAERLLPADAAPAYALSELHASRQRVDEARAAYRRAVEKDPSYRTPYRQSGLAYLRQGRLADAEAEFQRALAIEPADAAGLFGLAQLALRRQQWADAELLLQRSVAIDAWFVDAHRLLGDVRVEQGRYPEAIDAYNQSIFCALRGRRMLGSAIVTPGEQYRPADPGQGSVYARIGRAYDALGARDEAIKSYRASIAGRHDRAWIRAALVRLLVVNGQWSDAAAHAWPAVRAWWRERSQATTLAATRWRNRARTAWRTRRFAEQR